MIKLGKAFSDNVITGKRWKLGGPRHLTGWGARITMLYLLAMVSFFLLVVRLFHLTIVLGEENRRLSEANRVRTAVIHAPRGIFRDRRDEPLVENIPASRIIGPCEPTTDCRIRLEVSSNSAKNEQVNSVFVEKDYLRKYLVGYETAHLLGYLSEISASEINNALYQYQNYLIGDRLGRSGLEEVFEKELRGVDGKELLEVDSQNQIIRTLGKIAAIPGKDITLAIDSGLQKVAYAAMGENPGAVVVSKPKTGEILALVSTPAFDPNLFNKGISQREFGQLENSVDQPLFNRAVSGVYPPGSVFKLISAVAGLESHKITGQTQIEDTGILREGVFSFSNWYYSQYGRTEGNVDLLKAIARSNDIYFYKLGQVVGVEELARWGKIFGIGQKTGVELPGEAEGVMPDPDWRKKVRNEEWYLGDTYHLAIGQGDLQTTPLQVNRWTSVFASGGNLCKLTLLKTDQGDCLKLPINPEYLNLIQAGMRQACHRGDDVPYQGTGWPFFDFAVQKDEKKYTVPVACKTGSAEFGDPDNKTHAWFTAFAPLPSIVKDSVSDQITGEPEIVVTVLVEKGGEGSSVAGPIAKKILEEWFRR